MPFHRVTSLLADLEAEARLERAAGDAMRQGLRHLARGRAWAHEALRAFETALACREHPVPDVSSRARFALAGTWLNIATARLCLDRPGDAAVAEAACASAIALMAGLHGGEPARARRLAIAHHTRGRALMGMPGRDLDASAALTAAIDVLSGLSIRHAPDRDYLLAAAWVALADVRVRQPAGAGVGAIAAAEQALRLVRRFEWHDERAAEVGLVARHVCCRAAALALDARCGQPPCTDDVVHLATDAADDGLALARRWEHRGVTRFRSIAQDLYQFGAGVYGRFQPQFVQEFVGEHELAVRGADSPSDAALGRRRN